MIDLIELQKQADAQAPAQQTPPANVPATLPPTELVKLDLQTVALAHFGDWRADVAKARADLERTVLDLSIPARIAEAKGLRARRIGAPRAEARKVSNALKSKLAQASRAVGAEADAVVAAYDDAETLITPLIEAAEARIEAERAKREAEEARRLGELRAQVKAVLSAWLARCDAEGMTSERLAAGISMLATLAMPAEVAEVSGYWTQRRGEVLAKMESRRVDMAAAEVRAEQARLAAERERVAAIQRTIAVIQAAATTHGPEGSAADIAETREAVAQIDVSAEAFGEFANLASMTRAGVLASLDRQHADAVARERQQAEEAAAAAAEATRQAAEDLLTRIVQETQPGAPSPAAQGEVAGNLAQPEPGQMSGWGDPAAVEVAGGDAVLPDLPPAHGVDEAPALLAQDECRELSKALASKPDAPMHAREAVAEPVMLGPLLFEFSSFAGWVNHAQRAWKLAGVRSGDALCLDAKGRPCMIGRDFMLARDENQFPVRVYLLRDDMPQYQHLKG